MWEQILDTGYKIIVLFIGIVGIIAFFKGGWDFIKNFNKTSKAGCSFIDSILPKVLQGLEEKEIVPKGTLAEWTQIVSTGYASSGSALVLTEQGRNILRESGLQNVIDRNISDFIRELEEQRLQTALDIERESFYVLKRIENDEKINPVKNYLYNHPKETMEKIMFAGSIYLRDKYLEKHPEIIQ